MGKPGQTNSTSNYGRTVLQEHRNQTQKPEIRQKKKKSKDAIHIVMKSWENCHIVNNKNNHLTGRLERDWQLYVLTRSHGKTQKIVRHTE